MKLEPQNKSQYREFCSREAELPLFFQPEWLDIVCNRQWQAGLVTNKSNQLLGMMPYHTRKILGRMIIKMPPLTPYLGIWYNYPTGQKGHHARYEFEKKVGRELIGQLPDCAYYRLHLHPSVTNWMPFYRAGFEETTYFTFTIENSPDKSLIFDGFDPSIRRKIRQSERLLTIVRSDNAANFYEENRRTFIRQKLPVPYSKSLLVKLDHYLASNGRRIIYLARNAKSETVGGLYIVQDSKRIYYLASWIKRGGSPQGTMAMLVWQAIKEMKEEIRQFDFEGSMIPGVASFFASFRGNLTPYHVVRRYGNSWIKMAAAFRTRIR